MNVAELAGWLSQEDFDREFEAARELARSNPKVKWALQETLRAPLPFLTKDPAQKAMKERKAELEEAGFVVVGSIQRGRMIYGVPAEDESGDVDFVGGVFISGRAPNPPKG